MSHEGSVLTGVVLLVAGIYLFLPGLTRPQLFFAVTVPRGFRESPVAARIVLRFRVGVVVVSLAAAAAVWLLSGRYPAWAPFPLFLQLFALTGCFLLARAAVRPQAIPAASIRTAELAPMPDLLPGGLTLVYGPLLLLGLTALLAWLNWDSLPGRIPVHWGLEGPDRWVEREPMPVVGVFAMNGVVLLVLAATIIGTCQAFGRAVAGGPAGTAEFRFRRVTVLLLLGISYLLLVPMWVALFAAPAWSTSTGMLAWGGAVAGLVLTSLAILMWMGQGGSRLGAGAQEAGGDEAPAGDRRPDAAWKLGLFYYNPQDPAVFVEKRFGIGYTLNFGRPIVWLALVLLVPAMIALSVLF